MVLQYINIDKIIDNFNLTHIEMMVYTFVLLKN